MVVGPCCRFFLDRNLSWVAGRSKLCSTSTFKFSEEKIQLLRFFPDLLGTDFHELWGFTRVAFCRKHENVSLPGRFGPDHQDLSTQHSFSPKAYTPITDVFNGAYPANLVEKLYDFEMYSLIAFSSTKLQLCTTTNVPVHAHHERSFHMYQNIEKLTLLLKCGYGCNSYDEEKRW